MKKSSSIITGMALMAIALFLFCADNLICAIIGTCALFFALIFINYADSSK